MINNCLNSKILKRKKIYQISIINNLINNQLEIKKVSLYKINNKTEKKNQ